MQLTFFVCLVSLSQSIICNRNSLLRSATVSPSRDLQKGRQPDAMQIETMQYTDEEIKSLQSGYELQRRIKSGRSTNDESVCFMPGRLIYQSKGLRREGNECCFSCGCAVISIHEFILVDSDGNLAVKVVSWIPDPRNAIVPSVGLTGVE
jgi:hypothetical protein